MLKKGLNPMCLCRYEQGYKSVRMRRRNRKDCYMSHKAQYEAAAQGNIPISSGYQDTSLRWDGTRPL